MLSGIGFSVYNVFAKDKEFQSLKQEYVLDKLTFRRNRVQERIWKYDDRHGSNFLNKTTIDKLTKDTYRELLQEYKDISDKIKEKYKKGK